MQSHLFSIHSESRTSAQYPGPGGTERPQQSSADVVLLLNGLHSSQYTAGLRQYCHVTLLTGGKASLKLRGSVIFVLIYFFSFSFVLVL